MAKNKTGLIVGIIAVVVVIAVVVGVIVANNNKGENKGGTGGDNGGGTSQTTDSTLTEADLTNVDETIAYGEFDAMQTLSKSIQNGEKVGTVVKVDGIVSKPGSTYSIMQKNTSDTKKIGTKFVIEGAEEADYPKDGDRVVITGKVVEESPMVFIIKTIPSMVEKK